LAQASEIWTQQPEHPALTEFAAKVRDLALAFPDAPTPEALAATLWAGAQDGAPLVVAVAGDPLVGDTLAAALMATAGRSVAVVAGISWAAAALTALGLPMTAQVSLVDGLSLAQAHAPSFPSSAPALISSAATLGDRLGTILRNTYPSTHPLVWIDPSRGEKLAITLAELTPQPGAILFVPALPTGSAFEDFHEIIAHLRSPEGCPWDREQTHLSLRAHLLEETYEVLAALDAEDASALREELGDLLLQIMLHGQIAAEAGEFTLAQVIGGISAKLLHRHPHVFGDVDVHDTDGVLQNWERLKAEERAASGKAEASLLDGVGVALPALVQAEQYQKRAARVGFDWPDVSGVWAKFEEEIAEVRAAATPEEVAFELGDLFLALVNLARWFHVDPESALRDANRRFRTRFYHIEQQARQTGRSIADLSLDEMEGYWQEAKRL
jgi:tetrapyrrole methylase family protein/MazG family protein